MTLSWPLLNVVQIPAGSLLAISPRALSKVIYNTILPYEADINFNTINDNPGLDPCTGQD
jgi:hypothetical protein